MILPHPAWLLPAYAANILILVPVCWGMFHGGGVGTVFEGAVAESAGLRTLVGSLWFAILAASVLGLRWPQFFLPVILVQLIYKTLWLAVFVRPLLREGAPVPAGVAGSFCAIILTYPALVWLAARP